MKYTKEDVVVCDSAFCSDLAGKPLCCSTRINRIDFPHWGAFKTVLEAANRYPKHFKLIKSINYEIY